MEKAGAKGPLLGSMFISLFPFPWSESLKQNVLMLV